MKRGLSILAVISVCGSSLLMAPRATHAASGVTLPGCRVAVWVPAEYAHQATVKCSGDLAVVTLVPGSQSSRAISEAVTGTTHVPDISPCFPTAGVSWTWDNIVEWAQAWISTLQNDNYWGKHYNYHIQWFCGGDRYNWHIQYKGVQGENYTWEATDSVTGETKLYEAGTYLGETDAADIAGGQFAYDAIGTTGLTDLAGASYLELGEVFLALLLA